MNTKLKVKMIQTQGPNKGHIIYCDPNNTKFWEAEGYRCVVMVKVQ